MVVKTESQHKGEFLVSEGPGSISRESATLLSGEVVTDGAVVAVDGSGKLVASTGNAAGETIVGVVLGDHDASAGDVKNVPYIARLAEVKRGKVHIDATDPDVDADTEAELATRFIIIRESA